MMTNPIPSKGNLPKSLLFGGLAALGIMPQQGISAEKGKEQPNVIVILTDDVGYGDLGCYGATKVKTPNIDQLASEGIRFTSAYAPASTCTPSRFSLITGQYAWRKNAEILPGDAPMLIKPDELTLPALMQKQGYTTACVGKWHLGLGEGNPDFNQQIKPGLQTIGFDYSFIIPATNDRVPCVYLENDQVVGLEANDPI
ncbi:sulfatase-like hydrolase/transferase [Sunxiuqinia elliptica]|uniref:Sulfatase n=1 Tax=Sunxiuqinia elliptica TaxID=655355 RepID=A0A1I2G1Q6_9BACT|nr:sulfatase-like hydrolase/transferase [Sunxiuqinia elliptica]SFF11614.1 Sulfatase [Sunxiuqinia elliptica]